MRVSLKIQDTVVLMTAGECIETPAGQIRLVKGESRHGMLILEFLVLEKHPILQHPDPFYSRLENVSRR